MKHLDPIFKPTECPHCEYDRRFLDFEMGGWMQQDNNGPIVSCPLCNDDGSYTARLNPRLGTLNDERPHATAMEMAPGVQG